ncbi:hypothetical protein L1987_16454 [Smallanthus sonchifolius]|uniref:Uncharacterized protein n=1 Tax=Smallanthus sonchifolius TaxID=185202 RepID=A0ACB9J8Y2_9ASTR|nr:hypothetical protein L1987_16454 [Smallanthus sonchifolius]
MTLETEIWSHKHTHKHIKNYLEGRLGLSCLLSPFKGLLKESVKKSKAGFLWCGEHTFDPSVQLTGDEKKLFFIIKKLGYFQRFVHYLCFQVSRLLNSKWVFGIQIKSKNLSQLGF